MVEHYTRFIILVPVPDKEAKTTAEAFTRHVLSIWGSPAEVLTDQGSEFRAEFDELLHKLHIDHRHTQAYSPQGNGAAERVVQTVKSALSKLQSISDIKDSWDVELWKLALAYNSTPQESTQLQPFVLMFAQEATIPEEARSKLKGETVQNILEGTGTVRRDHLVNDLVKRSRMLEIAHLHAGLNLHIAQHRDYVRYMSLHEEGHPARTTGYRPGEYVMVWQKPRTKLDVRAKPTILQVVETLSTGVVLLRGADGAIVKSQASHLSPCPVQVHPMVDARDRIIPAKEACQVCESPARWSKMILCDSCNRGWHIDCLDPPLDKVPEGAWFCPNCAKKRAAPTAQERLKNIELATHKQELTTERLTKAAETIKAVCQATGVRASMEWCMQLMHDSDPEAGMELHSEKTPGEQEKEQKALLRRFTATCLPKQQRQVHATASMITVRKWIWEALYLTTLPSEWQSEDAAIWVIDVSSTDIAMILLLIIEFSVATRFVIAIKCQQVEKAHECPGLDCQGKEWQPLLTIWTLQGRLQISGSPPDTWIIVGSTASETLQLFKEAKAEWTA